MVGDHCAHINKTRQGSNAYRKVLKCKDCGTILEDIRTERDVPMTTREAKDCPHVNKDRRGTTGTSWASEALGSEAALEPSPFTLTGDATEVDMILDLVKITIELQRELRQPMTVFMLDQIYDKCRARVLGRAAPQSRAGTPYFTPESGPRTPTSTSARWTPSPLAPHTPSMPPPHRSPSALSMKIESGVHKGKTFGALYAAD